MTLADNIPIEQIDGNTPSSLNGVLTANGSVVGTQTFKTVNGNSVLGSGDVAVASLAANAFTGKQSFSGTDHAGLRLNSLTTAEYDALVAADGDVFLNTQTNKLNARINGATRHIIDSSDGYHVGFLLKWGIHTASIVSVARTSNIATVTTSAPHGMIVGQKVDVNATTDNTFDVSNGLGVVLSVPTTTTFTYASTGSTKATTADTGTLTTWEVVSDASHAPTANARLSSIAASGVTVTWDSVGGSKVVSGTFGNHQNNSSAIFTPFNNGVGLTTASIALRYRRTLTGRAYWTGTSPITTNGNWTKEGDTTSVSYVDGASLYVLFIGHSSISIPTSGSLGVCSWPLPVLSQCGISVRPILPNYQVSPMTAAGYRPSATGFYCHLVNPVTGAILTQTDIQAISPASAVQIMWQRTVDVVLTDHTYPGIAVTVFQSVHMK